MYTSAVSQSAKSIFYFTLTYYTTVYQFRKFFEEKQAYVYVYTYTLYMCICVYIYTIYVYVNILLHNREKVFTA